MMTRNEAWSTMCAGINCPDVSPTETIGVIQLDAFKAGAEWAASQVVNFTIDNPTVECGRFAELHYLIKQEASNLKEIPK